MNTRSKSYLLAKDEDAYEPFVSKRKRRMNTVIGNSNKKYCLTRDKDDSDVEIVESSDSESDYKDSNTSESSESDSSENDAESVAEDVNDSETNSHYSNDFIDDTEYSQETYNGHFGFQEKHEEIQESLKDKFIAALCQSGNDDKFNVDFIAIKLRPNLERGSKCDKEHLDKLVAFVLSGKTKSRKYNKNEIAQCDACLTQKPLSWIFFDKKNSYRTGKNCAEAIEKAILHVDKFKEMKKEIQTCLDEKYDEFIDM